MKDVCIAYADKSGNGFSVSEPWIEDNFNTLEDCEQKALNTPAQYDERPVVDFLSFLP